jgi:tryptophan 2,3-dioxygenase
VRYRDYLHLDTLLCLQQPRVPPGDTRSWAAEHLFIVVHQTCELWLAQILLDLDHATTALTRAATPARPTTPNHTTTPDGPTTPGDPASPDGLAAATAAGEPAASGAFAAELAAEHLVRAAAAFAVLLEQVAALDRLPHHSFARFRPHLGTASGAQSGQFRELDRRLGVGPQASPVCAAFRAALTGQGADLVDIFSADLAAGALHRVADALLAIGQGYWRWKVAHLALASRLIGDATGTGGTSGADHLARRVRMPFPELRRAQQQALLGCSPGQPPT